MKEPKYKIGDAVYYYLANCNTYNYIGSITQVDDAFDMDDGSDSFCRRVYIYKIKDKWIKEQLIRGKVADSKYERVFMDLFTMSRERRTPQSFPEIQDVIYHEPATIILFKDGTKSVVKVSGDDVFDKDTGFLLALLKRIINNKDYDYLLKAMEQYNNK